MSLSKVVFNHDADEPMLQDKPGLLIPFPIVEKEVWAFYKASQASNWTAEEICLNQDMTDWPALSEGEQYFLTHVLAFFANSDGQVNQNLCWRFLKEVKMTEAQYFYVSQMAIENVHAETYAMLLDTFVKDKAEKMRLFNAIETIPAIKKKADWVQRWIESSSCFAERLVAFAAVEGLFFSGSFCSIFWMKKRGKLPGLAFSNELISRDEGLHCDFACLLYSMLRYKLPTVTVHSIISEAVEYETEFVVSALPVGLIGMNSGLMTTYVQFCADRLVYALGYPKIYGVANPFDWMELISLQGKTNFFEKRVSEYQKAGVMTSTTENGAQEDNVFTMDADF